MEIKKVKSHWNEEWLKVETKYPTRRNDYYISNYGRIKTVIKATGDEKFIAGSKRKYNFRGLSFRLEGNKTHSLYVHKFVALNFVEKEREDQVFVVHKDQDKNNNYWKNLQWVNQAELTAYQKEIGVYDPANRNMGDQIKMTETKVRLLKKRIREGKTKKKVLARSFGISTMQLNRIERGENWAHVD